MLHSIAVDGNARDFGIDRCALSAASRPLPRARLPLLRRRASRGRVSRSGNRSFGCAPSSAPRRNSSLASSALRSAGSIPVAASASLQLRRRGAAQAGVPSELLQEIDGIRHSGSPRCRDLQPAIFCQAYAESSAVGSRAAHRTRPAYWDVDRWRAYVRFARHEALYADQRQRFAARSSGDAVAWRTSPTLRAGRSHASVVDGEPHPDLVERQRGEGVRDDGDQRFRREALCAPGGRASPQLGLPTGPIEILQRAQPDRLLRLFRRQRQEQRARRRAPRRRETRRETLRRLRCASTAGRCSASFRDRRRAAQYSSRSPSRSGASAAARSRIRRARRRDDSSRTSAPIERGQPLADLFVRLQGAGRRDDHRRVHVDVDGR